MISTIVISGLLAQKMRFPSDPNEFQFITSDIDRFWKVYDESKPDELEKNLTERYIKVGTQGLAFFNVTKIQGSRNLAKAVIENRAEFDRIRTRTMQVKKAIPEIKSALYAMKYLYPDATFPPVYCVIGRFNSGGTANQFGIMLGVEMEANRPEQMSKIVAHELVHFLQPHSKSATGLLNATVREGVADFVGNLASGGTINTRQWEYGIKHEKSLWTEWKTEVAGQNRILDWIGSYSQEVPRPGDLGYFIGARIAESYYNKALDKKAAIKALIECENPAELVRDSGYDPQ